MVEVAIPQTPEELQEFLDDGKRVKELGNDTTAWNKFINDYAQKFNKKDKGEADNQVAEQAKEAARKLLEENGYTRQKRVPMSEEAAQKGWSTYNTTSLLRKAHDYNDEAAGAVLYKGEDAFAHMGEWLQHASAAAGIKSAYYNASLNTARVKDMSEAIGGDGGFLVPEEFRAELLRLALEQSVVRPRARVIPMGTALLRFPTIRDTSHASTVFGGISGTWKAEAASVSSSTNQPTFSQVKIEPYKLTAYTVASNEVLADSAIALEALIGQLYPEAIAYFEDDAFINGTGVGQPLGFKNASALVTVSKETGQAATSLVYENLIKMYARMLPSSLQRGVWVAHPDTLPQLAQMSLAVGTGGSSVWVMNASQSLPMSIFGRPLIFSEKMQTLGTANDIAFVDFGQYLIGDRQAMTMARSEHVNFTTDEVAWRVTQRVDGRPWLTSALTPRNGSNTFSFAVNLATRS